MTLVKFNSKKWKPGIEVKTRDGQKVRILDTSYSGETGHSVVAAIQMEDGKESVQEFMENGEWSGSGVKSGLDLIMVVPEYGIDEGDLVIGKYTGRFVLAAKIRGDRLESYISINPRDLAEIEEGDFNPGEFRKATKPEYDEFEFLLSLMSLSWDPFRHHLVKTNPVIDFSPLPDEKWEVSINGKSKVITNHEYEELYS